MKAVYCTQYGGVEHLKILDVDKPVPGNNEILVQVATTTVQTADWRVRTLNMPAGMGFLARLIFGYSQLKQPILGTELAGKIVSVGKNVTRYKIGDLVVASTGAKFGAHAEFAKLPEQGIIASKPDEVSFQEIVSLPFGGMTSLDFLKYKAKVKPGEKVLVIGASGAVGVAAVQIAKILGANVTGVCGKDNVQFVKSLGADNVINYAESDFWKSDLKYDVIFDVVGKIQISQSSGILNKNGRLVLVSAGLGQMLGGSIRNLFSDKQIFSGVVGETKEKLAELVELTKNGKYKSIVGKEFTLQEIAEAHRCVESRHKRGNVIVNINIA